MKFAAALLSLAGCGGASPSFTCMTDAQCTLASTPGMCVDKDMSGKGVCALADGSCPSGWRYDTSAGSLGGQCVPPSNNDMAGDMAVSMNDGGDMTQPQPDLSGDAAMQPEDMTFVPPDLSGRDFAGLASISVVAGRLGIAGSMDSATGTMATFNQPTGLATDGTNIYVTDYQSSIIRQVVIASGAVSTIAGTAGMPGLMDGTGGAAKFYNPEGLATDGTNVFVADTANCFLRNVVASSGVTTSLAGAQSMCDYADGTGSSGHLFRPHSLWYAGSSTIYIGDGNKVRKAIVAGTTATITTIAGMGSPGNADGTSSAAGFNTAHGITGDGAGNLYVADYGNCTVRQVVISSQAVTTLAGLANTCASTDGVGNAARFRNPWGISYDGAGSLFVSDEGSGAIRKVDIASKTVTTWAGGLGSPTGIVWYTAGSELFIADGISQTINKAK